MATTEVDRERGGDRTKRKQGGFRTMPFILVNEVCDMFATAGFNANLITYLTQELHLPLVEASNTLTNINGTSSLTPILGALAADSFAGRFWTIIAGSVFYQLGMLGLIVSVLVPSLRPGPCSPPATPCRRANGLQFAVLYFSLLLTSLGSGGIRPCVVSFGADQFDQHKEQRAEAGGVEAEAGRQRQYFNLYFFTMGIAVLLALTVVVYIQENVGWGWGFGIPAIAMFVSILVFVIGYPLYVRLKPGGSPFTRLAQVVAAAYKKRAATVPEDPGMLYQDKDLDALISTNGRLLHTNQLTTGLRHRPLWTDKLHHEHGPDDTRDGGCSARGSGGGKRTALRAPGGGVRGTARDPADSKNAHLLALDGAEERLTLCRADLLNYDSLRAAFAGCHGVFHAASLVSNDPVSPLLAIHLLGFLLAWLNFSSSHVGRYLTGAKPTYPNAVAAYTDVRDVARAHVLAYERPDARGRYLCIGAVLHRPRGVHPAHEDGSHDAETCAR